MSIRMTKQFDLLVIGGGSAGVAAAKKAAAYGAKVALFEGGPLGGTCVNVGCVPKKIMWYASEMAQLSKLSADFGFDFKRTQFNFKKLVKRRSQFVTYLNHVYQQQLETNRVHYIKAYARFIDAKTLKVNQDYYTGKHIIIATGSYPTQSTIKGAMHGIDSDGFFALTKQPKHVAIVGAGYVAVELAAILQQLGSEVKMLIRHQKPLRYFDNMLSQTITEIMQNQGIHILTQHDIKEVTLSKQNKITIHCEKNKKVSRIDCLIFAIGRTPCTQHLNLDAIRIKCDEKGFIKTNKFDATNIPHIYAIGDVTGKKMLTPVAIACGRRLAARLFAKSKAYVDYHAIPSVVFSHPPIATVGLTEQEAILKYGRDKLKIYQTTFNGLLYALSSHAVLSRMKLITLKSNGKIIGCHLIGTGADEILQGFAVAIKMGATKKDLDETMAIHPTSAEELVSLS